MLLHKPMQGLKSQSPRSVLWTWCHIANAMCTCNVIGVDIRTGFGTILWSVTWWILSIHFTEEMKRKKCGGKSLLKVSKWGICKSWRPKSSLYLSLHNTMLSDGWVNPKASSGHTPRMFSMLLQNKSCCRTLEFPLLLSWKGKDPRIKCWLCWSHHPQGPSFLSPTINYIVIIRRE